MTTLNFTEMRSSQNHSQVRIKDPFDANMIVVRKISGAHVNEGEHLRIAIDPDAHYICFSCSFGLNFISFV